MTTLLKQSNLLRFLIASLFVCIGLASQAQVILKGKVTGPNGAAISNASVQVEPSNAGGNTDASGNYSITATLKPGKYTLVFSSVGYKGVTKGITVTGNDAFDNDVTLAADPLGLDEVVVTGTTVATSKRRLGNAISTVSSKDIQNSGASSIDGALQGKVVGAQVNQNSGNPAGGISITLRGVSTIAGTSEPLYILDGVIINNDSRQLIDLGGGAQNRLVDISPSDIDHIEVIKGASAAAIYGSRASNGVVQIFTKKGKSGKPNISFSTQLKTSSIRKKLAVNKEPFVFVNPNNNTDFTKKPVTRYDYQDDIFQKGMGTDNNLSVSGGTDNTKYYFSLSNFYNQGIIGNTSFGRNGLRLNIDQKINNYISATMSASYTNSTSREIPNGGINSDYGALTGFIFANNFVNPVKDPVTGIYPSVTVNTIGLQRTNPLEAIDIFKFKQRTNRFIGSTGIKIKPMKGLSIDYLFGIDNYTQLATAFIPVKNTTATLAGGFSRRADANVTQLNNDLNIVYKTSLSKAIQSTTSVGATIQYDNSLTSAQEARNLAPFGQVTGIGGMQVSGESREERSFGGQYLQQSFDILNKLFITGAIRSDVSSIFGKENRRQFYPKVSGSYVLSNEEFWEKSGIDKYVSSIKFRAAWGRSGNLTGIPTFARFTNYNSVQYAGSTGYIQSSQLGNEGIKPEQQTEFEIGTDIGLFKDRVSIEFNYYKKDVKDLIQNITLAPGSGYLRQLQNIGNLSNKGIEFLIKGIPVQNKNITWVSTFSLNTNKNEVTGIEVITAPNGTSTGGIALSGDGFGRVGSVNGYGVGSFYHQFYARNPDGSLLLTPAGLPQAERGILGANGEYTTQRNAAGQPSGAILNKVIGSPLPKQLMSFINEINIKKFSFRMQFDGAFGFDVFNFTRRVGQRSDYGGLADYEKEIRGEVPKGTSVAIFNISEEFIEKGDYIKLRELSLGYDYKPKVNWVKNIRFSLTGRNLFSSDNYSGYDPEINTAGQSNSTRGFDFVEVPLPKTFAFGINVNF